MSAPERPPTVPLGATFDAESALWVLCEHDERGQRHGAFSTFRADGELFTRGSYEDGQLEGTSSRFTSERPGAPALRSCCVPPGARELRSRYRAGRLLGEIFYDARGNPLCDDGTPWPERPDAVPEDAAYDEVTQHFVARREAPDGKVTLSHFNLEGLLAEEVDARAGAAEARRVYAPDGTCTEETHLDDNRLRHGPYLARVSQGENPYLDARLRELAGQHEHGEPTGTWELRDATGVVLRSVSMGARLDTAPTPLVTGTEPGPEAAPERLWQAADELTGAKPREALALAARALGRSGDRARFEHFLSDRTIGLRPELAQARAEEAANGARVSVSSLLGAALLGGAPAVLLRRLSALLSGHAPAALDFLDASRSLSPEQPMFSLARGLTCIEQGAPEEALAAAERVAAESEAGAALLREFCRIAYGDFPFRPAQDGVAIPDEELIDIAPAQPLAAVRRGIGLYATRLGSVREELRRRGHGESRWLPPDVRQLLPEGPVELRRFTAHIEDEGEGEEAPGISEVAVDETLALDKSTRELMVTSRSDWAALTWLCWSAGLDEVALPDAVKPRPNFAAAIHQATLRCWRAHDRVRTQGLVALARHVPSFDWEGMPIDDVPTHLAEMVAAEYLEVRAQFLWLLFEQNPSPFQADLRRV